MNKHRHLFWTGLAALTMLSMVNPSALAQPPEATVELSTVTTSQNSSVVRLPGTVISTSDAEISAELNGRLTWIARVGDQVESGSTLAVIDDHLLALQLREDEAEIARTQADIEYNGRQMKRLRQLANHNNTAQSELDAVESRMDMLAQDLRMAEVRRDRTLYDIERTHVLAPFSGIVVSRSMNVGEYTETGAALLRLVDTNSLEISVNAPMRVARYNQPGNQIQVETDERQMLTEIRGVVPVGDPRSHMMEFRLSLQAGEGFIGEAVTVELPDGAAADGISVPRDALVLRSDRIFVYSVSSEGKAVRIPVTPGAGQGSRVAITGDLEAGDPVIIRGAERLREGQSVKVLRHILAIN